MINMRVGSQFLMVLVLASAVSACGSNAATSVGSSWATMSSAARNAPVLSPDPVPFSATGAPEAFTSRLTLPSCGSYVPGLAQLSAIATGCFRAAVGTAKGAELVVSRPSVEGDPVITYLRALPQSSLIEVFTDSTRDRFGRRVWTHTTCARFDSVSGFAGECGPAAE